MVAGRDGDEREVDHLALSDDHLADLGSGLGQNLLQTVDVGVHDLLSGNGIE